VGDQLKLNFEGARTFPAETKSARPSSPAQIPFAVLVVYMHLEERPAPSPKKTTCRTVDDPTAALCLLLKTEIAGPTGRRLTVFELLLNAARMAADSTTIDNRQSVLASLSNLQVVNKSIASSRDSSAELQAR